MYFIFFVIYEWDFFLLLEISVIFSMDFSLVEFNCPIIDNNESILHRSELKKSRGFNYFE